MSLTLFTLLQVIIFHCLSSTSASFLPEIRPLQASSGHDDRTTLRIYNGRIPAAQCWSDDIVSRNEPTAYNLIGPAREWIRSRWAWQKPTCIIWYPQYIWYFTTLNSSHITFVNQWYHMFTIKILEIYNVIVIIIIGYINFSKYLFLYIFVNIINVGRSEFFNWKSPQSGQVEYIF